jgi:ankyrin repeat protein
MPPRSLPTRTLREHPDIDQLKRQAQELLAAFHAGQPEITAEVTAHYRAADPATFALHDAQLVIARAYGFESWPKLKAYVDGVTVAGLADAVRAGDITKVRAMLAARPELVHMDMSEHNEHRSLHYAVLERNAAMVRVLMEHGADPHKGIWPHRYATSALTIASERGYEEIVAIIKEALEHRKAEETARNRAANPPNLDMNSALIKRLIPAMIEPNGESTLISCLEEEPRLIHAHKGDGWTMLHQASLMLFLDVARWLIDHDADVNAYEPSLWTPLELVGRYRKTFTPEKAEAMKQLLVSHGAKMTAGAAIVHRDADWLRARHAEGTLTNPPGPYGLVTRAVIADRPDMLNVLLDLGFDPDERGRSEALDEVLYSWGEPLRSAVRGGRPALAEILLKRGADPNPSIYAATTPMFEAYARGDRDMIALLERHGGFADALVAGSFGLTEPARQMLADEAAGRLRPRTAPEGISVAERLLDSGASGGHIDIVRLALDHLDWPPNDERWHWNLMRPLGAHPENDRDRYLKCFELMVERAGANAPGPYGRTILHDVCAAWPTTSTANEPLRLAMILRFATILLDAGAQLDIRDDLLKSTPLGWACRWGRVDLVRLFLNRGTDPTEADAEPWATPRAWAEKMKHDAVVAVLRDYALHSDKSRSG